MKELGESLKDRFLTHISRHLNMYKLSRSNIWRVEEGLGILEAKTMFCDTDMEEESSVVSDTIVKQKIFRKRINLNKSTSSTENGVDEKTKRKSKHSRYDSSILPNSVSKNKSNENIENENSSELSSDENKLSDEIEKLNQLLKDGVLTQKEFEKAKKKLLDN